jgi:prepilin-type N-terminal cleavage/methylation domain-containing protein
MMRPRFRQDNRGGFTLIELAIVMGISAMVLGAIWGAASHVYMQRNIHRVEEQWQHISNAVIAMGRGVGSSANTVMNPILVKTGAFPADMINLTANTISNPWLSAPIDYSYFSPAVVMTGAYIPLLGFTMPSPGWGPVDSFEVGYDGIPQEACISLVHEMTSPSIAANVKSIFINTYWPVIQDGVNVTSMGPTVPLGDIVDACDPANNATGYSGTYIDIVYMLRL